MKIHKLEDMLIGQFGMELKELMIKYDIKSLTPLYDGMNIEVKPNHAFIMMGCNIQTGIGEEAKSNIIQFPIQ